MRYRLGHLWGEVKNKRQANAFLNQEFKKETDSGHDVAVRLRMALEELGPTFIKIGQLLSTRVDLLPENFVKELSKLQDSVAPVSAAEAINVLESELGLRVQDNFQMFDREPMAVASIGQVHRATLHNGEEVVIKIKKPNIEPQIIQDLEIMENMVRLLERNTSWGKAYGIGNVASEIKKNLLEELDYKNEARNADKFKQNFYYSPEVVIPRVYWEHTTRNVLTLEYREGYQLNNLLKTKDETEYDCGRIAETIVGTYFKQIFDHGFFHGDPHPGNILVLSPEQIMFVDFGTAGYINDNLRAKFQFLLKSILSEQIEGVADGVIDLGFAPPDVNRKGLITDLERLQDKYYNIPLDNIDLGEILQEFVNVSSRHNIRMPSEFILLVKTLGTLEGIVSQLDPNYKLINFLYQFGHDVQNDFMINKQLKDLYFALEKFLLRVPDNITRITENTAEGELKVKIELVNTDHPVNQLGKFVNRLSISIVLASLFIALSLTVGQINSGWPQTLPLREAAFVGAGALGIWWLVTLLRSEK